MIPIDIGAVILAFIGGGAILICFRIFDAVFSSNNSNVDTEEWEVVTKNPDLPSDENLDDSETSNSSEN